MPQKSTFTSPSKKKFLEKKRKGKTFNFTSLKFRFQKREKKLAFTSKTSFLSLLPHFTQNPFITKK